MPYRKIERKIKKIVDNVVHEMTYDIFFEIESAYERIVDKFYDDYAPKYYNRTFSIYKASNVYDSFSIGVNHKGKTGSIDGYEIGIHVSSDNIIGNPYSENKETVFNRTFVHGIHGFARNEIGEYVITNPSPKEQMDEWFEDFKTDKKKIKKIGQDAIKRALRR